MAPDTAPSAGQDRITDSAALKSRAMLDGTRLDPHYPEDIHAVRQRLDRVSAVAQVEQAEALTRIAVALERMTDGT